VCPWQDASTHVNRPYGSGITTVYTRRTVQHTITNDFAFKLVELTGNLICGELTVTVSRDQSRNSCLTNLTDPGITILLIRNLIGLGQVSGGLRFNRIHKCGVNRRRLPVPGRLAGLGFQFIDSLDSDLHLLMAKYHSTQHYVFRQTVRF